MQRVKEAFEELGIALPEVSPEDNVKDYIQDSLEYIGLLALLDLPFKEYKTFKDLYDNL